MSVGNAVLSYGSLLCSRNNLQYRRCPAHLLPSSRIKWNKCRWRLRISWGGIIDFVPSSGTLFTFNDACDLITIDSQQEVVGVITGNDGDLSFEFYAPSDVSHYSYATAACNIVDGELACSGGGYSIWNLCQQSLILSFGSTIGSGCYPATLIPQYVC